MNTHDIRVAIVADDLTGANDTAVQFARFGWASSIHLEIDDAALTRRRGDSIEQPSARPRAIATTADNRALDAEQARVSTAQRVATALDDNANRLFLKIDSTMRGSVGAQIDGARTAWAEVHARAIVVVCPAYPSMGRMVDDGRLVVDGVPVSETVVGRDPVTPVTSSLMHELIPGAQHVGRLDVAALAAAENGAVLLVDATTEADLDELAAVLARHADSVIPVGSAGLAKAMARHWHPRRDANVDTAFDSGVDDVSSTTPAEAGTQNRVDGLHVVQVTSLNEVSRTQADHLESGAATPIAVCRLTLDDVDSAESILAALQRSRADAPDATVVILRAPDERSASAGSPAAQRIAEAMGEATASLARSEPIASLGLVGGDGARATLRALGISSVSVLRALTEGVPFGIAEDGELPQLRIWTKAGGFGAPDSLSDIVRDLTGSSAALSS